MKTTSKSQNHASLHTASYSARGRVKKPVASDALDASTIVKRGLFVVGGAFALAVAGSTLSANAQEISAPGFALPAGGSNVFGEPTVASTPVTSLDAPAPVSSLDAPAPVSSLDAPAPVISVDVPEPVSSLDGPAPVSSLDAQPVPVVEPGVSDSVSLTSEEKALASIVTSPELAPVVDALPTSDVPEPVSSLDAQPVAVAATGVSDQEVTEAITNVFSPAAAVVNNDDSGLAIEPTGSKTGIGVKATDANGASIGFEVGDKGKVKGTALVPLVDEEFVKIVGTGALSENGGVAGVNAKIGSEVLAGTFSADTAGRGKVGVEGKLGEDTRGNVSVNEKGVVSFGVQSGPQAAPGAKTNLSDEQVDQRIDYSGLEGTPLEVKPTPFTQEDANFARAFNPDLAPVIDALPITPSDSPASIVTPVTPVTAPVSLPVMDAVPVPETPLTQTDVALLDVVSPELTEIGRANDIILTPPRAADGPDNLFAAATSDPNVATDTPVEYLAATPTNCQGGPVRGRNANGNDTETFTPCQGKYATNGADTVNTGLLAECVVGTGLVGGFGTPASGGVYGGLCFGGTGVKQTYDGSFKTNSQACADEKKDLEVAFKFGGIVRDYTCVTPKK